MRNDSIIFKIYVPQERKTYNKKWLSLRGKLFTLYVFIVEQFEVVIAFIKENDKI